MIAISQPTRLHMREERWTPAADQVKELAQLQARVAHNSDIVRMVTADSRACVARMQEMRIQHIRQVASQN